MDHNQAKGVAGTILALTVCGLITATAQAEIYKWTDIDGQVHYSGTPPPDQQAETFNIKSNTVTPPVDDPVQATKETKVCGALTLPSERPDPLTNIAMYRSAIKVWQKFIEENTANTDEKSRKALADRRCAIEYSEQRLQDLAEAEQGVEENLEKATEQLAELREAMKGCDELEAEEARTCRNEYQQQIQQQEKMLHTLERQHETLKRNK